MSHSSNYKKYYIRINYMIQLYSVYSFGFVDNDGEFYCYVGSSSNIRNRKTSHKSSCYNPNSREYNKYAYRVIREKGINWDDINWDIHETGMTKKMAYYTEDVWINILNANLNRKINGNYSGKVYTSLEKEYICICGTVTTNRNKHRHRNTRKHIQFMEHQLNEDE